MVLASGTSLPHRLTGSITPVSQPFPATACLSQVPSASHRGDFRLLLGPLGLGTDPACPTAALSSSGLAQVHAFPSAEPGVLLRKGTPPVPENCPWPGTAPSPGLSVPQLLTLIHVQGEQQRPTISLVFPAETARASLSHPQGSSRRRPGLRPPPRGGGDVRSDPTSWL